LQVNRFNEENAVHAEVQDESDADTRRKDSLGEQETWQYRVIASAFQTNKKARQQDYASKCAEHDWVIPSPAADFD
jgi:hypothetical protein